MPGPTDVVVRRNRPGGSLGLSDSAASRTGDRLEGDAAAEWRRHWTVVLAGTAAMALCTLNVYSIGLFLEPLQRQFGWSRAEITLGPLISACVALLSGPFVGSAIDRFGPRRIGIGGLTALCVVTIAISQVGPSIWSWWAVWSALAMVNGFIQPMVWTAALAGYFRAGRGLAFAAALCGSGLGALVIPRLTYTLIQNFGWRGAYVGLGVVGAVVVLPLVILFFTSRLDHERIHGVAAPTAQAARGDFRALRSGTFLQLALAALLIAIVVVSMAVSVVPVLSWNGLTRAQAAGVASILGATSIGGRLAIGVLLDRFDGRWLALLSVSLPIVSSLVLLHAPGSVPAALLAIGVLGLALGTELDLVAYLASRHFALRNYGLLFGTIAGLIAVAGSAGPWLISLVYDQSHSYRLALWAVIPLCVCSGVLFVSLGRYPEERRVVGVDGVSAGAG